MFHIGNCSGSLLEKFRMHSMGLSLFNHVILPNYSTHLEKKVLSLHLDRSGQRDYHNDKTSLGLRKGILFTLLILQI